jgi:AcrR family transcriptional regulator
LFREKGYDGIGVADLMKNAGLTHGGFYGHFASKEDLLAEAAAHALDKSVAPLAGYLAEGARHGAAKDPRRLSDAPALRAPREGPVARSAPTLPASVPRPGI